MFTLVAMAGAVAAGSPWAAPPGSRTLHVADPVLGISADGDLVAVNRYVLPCDGIVVWNASTGRSKPVRRSAFCEDDWASTNLGALGGERVVWHDVVAANTYSDIEVLTAVAGGGKPAPLYDFETFHDPDEYGPQIGGFAGDGDLLVYGTWKVATSGAVTNSRLLRVEGSRQRIIHRFGDAIVSASVDADRIAVAETQTVSVLDRAGSLLREIRPPIAKIDAVALHGPQLVVAGPDALVAYDAVSGRRVRSLPLARGSRLDDLANGVAVVVRGATVHARRVADGRDVVVARPRGYDVHAQIEPAGLTYAYTTNDNKDAYVVFVPWQALQRRLG
jgi:hypothetical protein